MTDPAPQPTCRCGCPAAVHEHYRPGTDCGRCGPVTCRRYQPPARHGSRSPIGIAQALLNAWAHRDRVDRVNPPTGR